MKAELILDCQNQLGEGPVWHAARQRLYWVDFDGCTVLEYDPTSKSLVRHATEQRTMVVLPTATGRLLLAQEKRVALFDADLKHHHVARELDADQPNHRCNDGKCDARGRLWIGTMDNEASAEMGNFYCVEHEDLAATRALTGFTIPNGMAWSANERLFYLIDSPTRQVQCFDFDGEQGQIGPLRSTFSTVQVPGIPDGMAIDAEGTLWIAQWGGACVGRWDPGSGQLLTTVQVPAALTTSCAFGGPTLSTLYITSSRKYASAEELAQYPLSGGLFSVNPGVEGPPAHLFQD